MSRCCSVEESSSSKLSIALISAPGGHPPTEWNASDSDSGSSLTYVTPPESATSSPYSTPEKSSSSDEKRTDGSVQGPKREELTRGRCQSKNVGFTIRSPRASYKRLKSPDRFLPERRFEPVTVESFRLARSPSQLSPVEKAYRRRDIQDDPFRLPNSTRSPLPRRVSSPSRSLSPRSRPRHVEQTALGTWHNPEYANSRSFSNSSPGWIVGGAPITPTSPAVAIPDGQGRFLGSGTLSPMYMTSYKSNGTAEARLFAHQSRLALALDIDQASRVLKCCDHTLGNTTSNCSSPIKETPLPTWKNCAWECQGGKNLSKKGQSSQRAVPSTPFRVLDAPMLRDDFYCSTLAYCYTARVLAVGLSNRVYLWAEAEGVRHPPLQVYQPPNYVTSLSFSSYEGRHSILAVGRCGGHLALWSTFDSDVRFQTEFSSAVSSVMFKSTTTRRLSQGFLGEWVDTEELVVGDETGTVWYYSVEWTSPKLRKCTGWNGAMTLVAKISVHTQQICGMVWSPDGTYLATGGNDNMCFIFDIEKLLEKDELLVPVSALEGAPKERIRHSRARHTPRTRLNRILELDRRSNDSLRGASTSWWNRNTTIRPVRSGLTGPSLYTPSQKALLVQAGQEKHSFRHAAAVKALAFAPWQPSLLATGGGSNDRCIRFFHAPSGSCLATINVQAQVTSLIWSKTRREIAATFGYAQPAHPYRIAVFAWPSCQQVLAIPWTPNNAPANFGYASNECGRALWAISYPGGPNEIPIDDPEVDHEDSQRNPSSTASVTSTSPSIISSTGATTGSASEPQSPTSPAQGSSQHQSSRFVNSYREGGRWWPRTAEEGCIIVASSDECVKFHEVWSGNRKSVGGTSGLLGGSEILEALEGIEREGREVIR